MTSYSPTLLVNIWIYIHSWLGGRATRWCSGCTVASDQRSLDDEGKCERNGPVGHWLHADGHVLLLFSLLQCSMMLFIFPIHAHCKRHEIPQDLRSTPSNLKNWIITCASSRLEPGRKNRNIGFSGQLVSVRSSYVFVPHWVEKSAPLLLLQMKGGVWKSLCVGEIGQQFVTLFLYVHRRAKAISSSWLLFSFRTALAFDSLFYIYMDISHHQIWNMSSASVFCWGR